MPTCTNRRVLRADPAEARSGLMIESLDPRSSEAPAGDRYAVVILTNGNPHADRVTRALAARSVRIEAVVCEVVPFSTLLRRPSRPGIPLRKPLATLARWLAPTQRVT